MPAIDTEIVQD